MRELSRKLGEMNYDGLFSDITPRPTVRGFVIKKGEAETVYKRGTLFGFKEGSEGELAIMDSNVTPAFVLTDDVTVGTAEDEPVTVYTSGCFNPDKLITKDNYQLTAKDVDALRVRNIYLKAAIPAGMAPAEE